MQSVKRSSRFGRHIHRWRSVIVGALWSLGCGLLPVVHVAASSAATPLAQLTQAQYQAAFLASGATSASVQRALSTASTDLSSATAQSLWADSNDPIARPYGVSVFATSQQALAELHLALEFFPTVR
jgi:hypothetical protein